MTSRSLYPCLAGLLLCAAAASSVAADSGAPAQPIRIDFTGEKPAADPSKYPASWDYKGTWGVSDAKMYVLRDPELGLNVLRMSSDKESGTILYYKLIGKLDLNKTPIIRWKWKVSKLPAGGDGRDANKDDQAIGVYVGYGKFLRKSVSYRWETDTPVGAEGNITYARVVSVKWHCLRNKDSAELGKWVVEERNLAEDFKKDFGEVPGDVVLSLSINSQYTGTEAESFLEYVEFLPANAEKDAGKAK